MNIETANRLLKLRKEHNLSQEDLAQKLNISRQAVSKWERAEASPDTDKLIDLAKLYGVSVDELLSGPKETSEEKSAPNESNSDDTETFTENSSNNSYDDNSNTHKQQPKDSVNFKNGIHVKSANGDTVDIGLGGIHVVERGKDKVHIGFDGIHIFDDDSNDVSEERYKNPHGKNYGPVNINVTKNEMSTIYKIFYAFPFPLFAIMAFFCVGIFVENGWTFSWLSFLTIPIYYTTITAIKKRNLCIFCYPVLVVIAFFALGIIYGIWGYSWVIFLTIPFYYWICGSINSLKSKY